MMDFSQGAGAELPSSLIPKGQLAWAVLTVRGVKGSASGGQYLDCELTIDDGQPYARKKLWDMIGDPNHAGNSEGYRQMGMVAITRILEAGRGAGPNNPDGYKINSYDQLSGLRVAVKIGIEKGKDGYEDKNRVAEYLTPNPASQSGHRPFLDLQKGNYAPTGGATKPAQQQSGFGFAGGNGGGAPTHTGGFGNGGGQGGASGFSQPQGGNAGSAGQPNGTQTAGSGFAQTTNATDQSRSDPQATPQWLHQAAGGHGG